MKLEIGKEYKNGYGQKIKIVGKQGAYFIDDDVIPDKYYDTGEYAGPSTLSRQNDKWNLIELDAQWTTNKSAKTLAWPYPKWPSIWA